MFKNITDKPTQFNMCDFKSSPANLKKSSCGTPRQQKMFGLDGELVCCKCLHSLMFCLVAARDIDADDFEEHQYTMLQIWEAGAEFLHEIAADYDRSAKSLKGWRPSRSRGRSRECQRCDCVTSSCKRHELRLQGRLRRVCAPCMRSTLCEDVERVQAADRPRTASSACTGSPSGRATRSHSLAASHDCRLRGTRSCAGGQTSTPSRAAFRLQAVVDRCCERMKCSSRSGTLRQIFTPLPVSNACLSLRIRRETSQDTRFPSNTKVEIASLLR